MLKPKVILSHSAHRDRDVTLITFNHNLPILQRLKGLKGLRWSATKRSWYIPGHATSDSELFRVLHDIANVDCSNIPYPQTVRGTSEAFSKNKPSDSLAPIREDQIKARETFKEWMRSRRYSESTIGTYVDALSIFLRYFQEKALEEITNEDLIHFNNDYILRHNLSSSYQNQVINAVKLFFSTTLNRKLLPELVHRPKRAKLLPNVLSKEEIKLILKAHNNIKHRAILSLVYSCGLRRSEVLNLRLSDVDSKRGLIIVRQSKGKKDRVVPLSTKILDLLREYFIACKPRVWLFEGQDGRSKYDESSLASVLRQPVEKSQINKPVTMHWLRHSYATHLLESGTDLRYIQEILGHSRSTTTEIYTHVSNKDIQRIVSPFDSLW